MYRRNTEQHYGGYNLFQNADFNANVSTEAWKKMLTESCVTFFFFAICGVLSAILADEHLTLAVGTKKEDKADCNQLPAHELVHFKLELTPNYLNSYLKNTGC